MNTLHLILGIVIFVFLLGVGLQLFILSSHRSLHVPPKWTRVYSPPSIKYDKPTVEFNDSRGIDVTMKPYSIFPEPSHTPIESLPRNDRHVVMGSGTPSARPTEVKSTMIRINSNTPESVYFKLEKAKISISSVQGVEGSINRYLSKGLHLPLVLLTCNRPELLDQTIQNLMQVRRFLKSNMIVSQDGHMEEVEKVIQKYDLKSVRNTEGLRLRGGIKPDGAQTIAAHYKFSLDLAFEAFPDAPAVIVIEDDLLFSPDFIEYMETVGPILDVDATVLAISAWNDNGFTRLVKDPFELLRTDFFPGLGWLLKRSLYMQELQPHWPQEHWDHWLRSSSTHKGREIVYPEVPRTFHNGIKGTFMNVEMHERYFKQIAYNQDADLHWPSTIHIESQPSDPSGKIMSMDVPPYATALEAVYEDILIHKIQSCTHVRTVSEIFTSPGLYCMWIDLAEDALYGMSPPFEPVAEFFGIWHEHKRGSRDGVHQFHRGPEIEIFILNIHDSLPKTYAYLKPADAVILEPNKFDKALLVEAQRRQIGVKGVPASRKGQSCTEVCQERQKSCQQAALELLNTCAALMEAFPCRNCLASSGPDQPAYVDPHAEPRYQPGSCVYNTQPKTSICQASHPATLRLCACT